ncbi:MAG: D-alanyl-D-alanine carboxypeptidase [Alphaproteobacteria bacterium]|nr:D-alanyl-D-alanine carboxypeptidase [Alphaproteobacteria bacterium]
MTTRLLARALVALFALCFAAPQAAHAQTGGFSTPASHAAIMDADTGLMLFCQNCEAPMPPASMSKIMTMLIVAEALDGGRITEDTRFTISERAWRHGAVSDGSHMFLELNSQVRVGDLIRGAIIVSGNDACVALAEGIAGSEEAFVVTMNQRAQELGLRSARFRNVTGVPDPDHVISAADLARLTRILITQHPQFYRLYSERTFTFNNRTQQNRNPLLGSFGGADGVKTGHTNVSGYGLVGSAVLDGKRRIVVFNGMPSMAARASEADRLMRAAFFDFTTANLFGENATVAEADVFLGSRRTVPLVTHEPIILGLPRSALVGISAHVVYQGPLPAPIAAGDEIAQLVVEGPGFPRRTFPLYAGRKIGKANPFARAGAALADMFGGS